MEDNKKFYMHRVILDEKIKEPIISIQDEFDGLYVAKVKGLEDKGKPKNIYTEKYSESDSLRVYIPEEISREATEITLTLVFVGKGRREAYNMFYNYVNGYKLYYWDNVRNKKALLFLNSEVKPSDDIVCGTTKYIKADFKFQNIFGSCNDTCNPI